MERCSLHDQVVADVGAIKGNIDTLIAGQAEFRNDIKGLTEKIGNIRIDNAVEKTKIQPFYIVLGVITVLAVTKIGERIVLAIMKLFPFFKD